MKEADIRPQDLFNRYLELSRQDVARFFTDKTQFIDVPCPACGSSKAEFGLEKFGFEYKVCSNCKSLFLSPRPSLEMIDAYYRESEAVKFWGSHFYKETLEARREKIFKPRVELVAKLADQFQLSPAAQLADVGAGYGIFLEEVAQLNRFAQIIGIEPAPNLATICRQMGFPIIEKSMEEVEQGEIEVSLATTFEVLEHVYSPLEFLQGIRRILHPGGLLFFTTLTVSGFDIQLLWEHSKSIYPPHHVNLMSVEGFEQLVARAGFEVVELTTPGKLDVDIVINTLKENPQIQLPRFVSYLLHDRNEATHQAWQQFLSDHRLSSHIRVIAKAV